MVKISNYCVLYQTFKDVMIRLLPLAKAVYLGLGQSLLLTSHHYHPTLPPWWEAKILYVGLSKVKKKGTPPQKGTQGKVFESRLRPSQANYTAPPNVL